MLLSEGFMVLSKKNVTLSINYNIEYFDKPILLTEGITDKIILENAWQNLYDYEMPFYIQDCFGAGFLRSLLQTGNDKPDGIFHISPTKKFIALFDFDEKGYNQWNALKEEKKWIISVTDPFLGLAKTNNQNAIAILLPVPNSEEIKKQVIKNETSTFKHESHLTIELLFYGKDETAKYFIKKETPGGGEIIQLKGDKRDFALKTKNFNKKYFDNFLVLFESILSFTK